MNEYKGFLILQPAFIGDVILATSLIESIADKYPNDPIDFFLRKGNENLLENNPHINEIFIWDKKNNKYKNLLKIISNIRKKKYKAVINIHRFFTSGLVTMLAKSKVKTGYKQNPLSIFYTHKFYFEFREGLHETMRNFRLIEFLGTKYKKPVLYPSEKDFETIEHFTKKAYITIAPSSVWVTKQYPPEKWIKAIDNVIDKNLTVFLLGSKQDISLCQKIKNNCKTSNRITILAGKLTFLQSAALMKKAKMNYVNDSAPLHICSAINAPVKAIFCSTTPMFGFYPLSDNSEVIETEEKLSCKPCGIHGKTKCPEKHFKCAHGISIEKLKI